MLFSTRSVLIATAYFTLRSHALPRPAIPSYSVVAVDGGQNTAVAPTTIIQTVTDSKTSQPTVSVTIEETHAPATITIPSTLQAPTPVPHTITVNGEVTTMLPPTVVIPGSRTSYTTTAVVSETTTVLDAEHTTVFQQGPTTTVLSMVTPSTSYFDDGMWHTSYGVPVWPTQNAGHRQHNETSDARSTGQLNRGA